MWHDEAYRLLQQHQYQQTSNPNGLPVRLDEVKCHLNIVHSKHDALITDLIYACVTAAQQFTNTIFLTTNFKLYLDCFEQEIELRRKPNTAISQIQYYKDGTLTTVASTEYITLYAGQNDYYRVTPALDKCWPEDVDERPQAIEISFSAGYGSSEDIPHDLKNAIMQHVAQLYTNRGDCDVCDASIMSDTVKKVYRRYQVLRVHG